ADQSGNENEHDVDSVYHEIEHHVHVKTTRRERSKPMDLEKLRPSRGLAGCRNHRIESLNVADLQHAAVSPRPVDQLSSFFEIRSDWLLNENIDAVVEQINTNSAVIDSGNGQSRSIHFAQDFTIIRKRRGLVQRRNFLSAGPEYVDNTGKLHVWELGVEPRVILYDLRNTDAGDLNCCSTAMIA